MDWTDSEQGHMASCCECGDELTGFPKCMELSSLEPISSSRTTLHREFS